MNLHLKSPGEAPGFYPMAKRGKDLKYLSFSILELGGNLKEYTLESGDEELSLYFYTGPAGIEVESAAGRWETRIAERKSIAEAAPMVYIPAGSKVKLKSLNGAARITIGGAEGKAGVNPEKVEGPAIMVKNVGKDNWNRSVFTHIADNIHAAHLICGETVNLPGGGPVARPTNMMFSTLPRKFPWKRCITFNWNRNKGSASCESIPVRTIRSPSITLMRLNTAIPCVDSPRLSSCCRVSGVHVELTRGCWRRRAYYGAWKR